MKKFVSEKTYHLLFEAGVVIKGVVTVAEIILGVLFYYLSAQVLAPVLGLIGNSQPFWAFIFFSHGIVKLFFIGALLKKKSWAYPASAAVFSLFVIYQVYTLFYVTSLFLGLFTIFDILLIVLILHEYRHKRSL